MNIYDIRRGGKVLFLLVAIGVLITFVLVSNNLVNDLAAQERERMQIWADATKQIADIGRNPEADSSPENIDFLLSIIEQNHTIPVLLTDNSGRIMMHRNFDLPEEVDSAAPWIISPVNEEYLHDKLRSLSKRANVIDIVISDSEVQHLYYDDSKLLSRLSYYPYVQLLVMLAFIIIVYYAVNSTRKAEQNKVWVGLSKETAHQLGTPISSLMAWTQLLSDMGVDREMVGEMEKDVNRLSMIASRFSKIGSRPQMETDDLNTVVGRAASYMQTRISSRIRFTGLTSPLSPTSPAIHHPASMAVSTLLDNTAAITLKSIARSVTRSPPAIFRNTSFCISLNPTRFSSTASSILSRRWSNPVAVRWGVPYAADDTNA